MKSASCAVARRTTASALLPTEVTAMPEPKSMKRVAVDVLEDAAARTARRTPAVTVPTPPATAACLRAISSCDFGPGIAVTRRRSWGRDGPPDSSVIVVIAHSSGGTGCASFAG